MDLGQPTSVSGGNTLGYSASERKKLRKDTDEYDTFNGDSPKSATSQQSWDSGVGGIGKATTTKDASSKGTYWGDLGHNRSGAATKDLPEHPRFRPSEEVSETSDRHYNNPRLADQAVGGGVYNSNSGVGGPYYKEERADQFSKGGMHDPLVSGHKSVSIPSDDEYDDETPLGTSGIPPARNEYTGRGQNSRGFNGSGLNGSGLNGSGLNGNGLSGNGLSGNGLNSHGLNSSGMNGRGLHSSSAAYGTYGYNQNGRANDEYGSTQQQPFREAGMPKTSMLDPEPATTTLPKTSMLDPEPATTSLGRQPTTTGRAAGYTSPNNLKSGTSSTGTPEPTESSSNGRSHFGPGHEGAKVFHKCEHCGNDNNITRYFKNDVVYRLGD